MLYTPPKVVLFVIRKLFSISHASFFLISPLRNTNYESRKIPVLLSTKQGSSSPRRKRTRCFRPTQKTRGEHGVRPRVPPKWKGGTPATVVIGKIAFEFTIHTSWGTRRWSCSIITPRHHRHYSLHKRLP